MKLGATEQMALSSAKKREKKQKVKIGKRKKDPNKQKYDHIAQEEEQEIGEEDLEFFDEHGAYSSFLNSMDVDSLQVFGKSSLKAKDFLKRKADKKTKAQDDEEADVEALPRKKASTAGWGDHEQKQLLPIISKKEDGTRRIQKVQKKELSQDQAVSEKEEGKATNTKSQLQQEKKDKSDEDTGSSVFDSDEDIRMEDLNQSTPDQQKSKGVLSIKTAKSSQQLVLMRTHLRNQQKSKIAELCEAILENPEEGLTAKDKENNNETKMEQLFNLVEEDDFVIQQLATLSMLAVLQDILPSYRIRLPTEKELQQKVSKEVKKMREFEGSMLKSYQRYLKHLESLAKGLNLPDGKKSQSKAQLQLRTSAYRCLCELLKSFAHFNFGINLIGFIVDGLFETSSQLAESCYQALVGLFKADQQGETMLDTVKAVTKAVTTRLKGGKKGAMRAERAVRCLQAVPLRITEDQGIIAKKKARNKAKRLKKEKKSERAAREEDGPDDLSFIGGARENEEGRASADPVVRAACQAQALQEITLLYFRILKQVPPSVLLPVALEGLALVAHLINLDTVEDLMAVLQEQVYDSRLSVKAVLQCVCTALQTLQGPGQELQVDDKAFVLRLYQLMPKMVTASTHDINTLLKCIEIAFLKKTELSSTRVAGFMKRLASLSLHIQCPVDTFNVLRCIRRLLHKYKQTQQLLESGEDKCASGVYRGDLDDPEHSNPYATTLFELGNLKFHPTPEVADEAKACGEGRELKFGESHTISSAEINTEILYRGIKKPWYVGERNSLC